METQAKNVHIAEDLKQSGYEPEEVEALCRELELEDLQVAKGGVVKEILIE